MTKVLIDTDPGTDDALAIMMALNSTEWEVVGLTSVGGNANLANTTENALSLLSYLEYPGIPVARGASRPIQGNFENAYHVHGTDGIGVKLPSPTIQPLDLAAHDFIVESSHAFKGDLSIIAIGPLTNLAAALKAEPRISDWIAQIVVMGGAMQIPGNITPHAEFNIYNDPVSAQVVLNSGIPVTLIGLDVTTQIIVSTSDLPWIQSETMTAQLAIRILKNQLASANKHCLHDPLAVISALRPNLLGYVRCSIDVQLKGTKRGQTTAKYENGPVRAALSVKARDSKDLMKQLLQL